MLKQLLFIPCLFLFMAASGQALKLFPDSVKVDGELVLKNSTAGINGYLYNTGEGVTRFQQLGRSIQFTVGGNGFPQAGDTVFQQASLQHYFIKVLRNGLLQYRDAANGVTVDDAAGKIIFHPALQANEHIFIEGISGMDFSLQGGNPGSQPAEQWLNTGVRYNGNFTFTLRWATNAKTLYLAPRVAGLGSSTLAGFGLSGTDRLGDKISGWLLNNAYAPDWKNLAVVNYNTGNVLPVSDGGILGHNIETAFDANPDFIFVSLPSNDASAGLSVAQSLVNLKKIDTLARSRGIPVFFQTTQPRSSYNAAQQLMLKQLADSIRSSWPQRFVEGFNDLVDKNAPTPAALLPQYDQGDGTHLTGAANQLIADHFFDRLLNYFQPVKDVKRYIIDTSSTGSAWALFAQETDQNVVKKQYARPHAGRIHFRVRAEYRNGTFSPYSNTAVLSELLTPEDPGVNDFDHRILVDLGGDGVQTLNGSGIADGQPSPSPDGEGKYWNNWYGTGTVTGFANGSLIPSLKTSTNEPTQISMQIIGSPQGTFTSPVPTEAINYNGFTSQVGDYPQQAAYDNMFIHSGVNPNGITLRIKGLSPANTYYIKLWGARRDAATTQRTLQAKTAGEDWSTSKSVETRYSLTDTAEYNRAITFKHITGVDSLDINLRVGGGTFAHLSVVDVGVIGTLPPFPRLSLNDTSTTLSSLQLTATPVNGAVISSYQWVQLSGPNTAVIGNSTSATANISGLTNGTFVFKITGTTTTGNTLTAQSRVDVYPDNANKKTMRAYFSRTAAAPVPGWFNVYGLVTGQHIVMTDPVTGWTVDNAGSTNTYWTPLGGNNASNVDGATTGNNSGVIPDIVSKGYWYNYNTKYTAGTDNLLLKGLNPSKTYNITLHASRSSSGITGARYGCWRINGGAELLLNALDNTVNKTEVLNVSPDANGVIRIAAFAPDNVSNGNYSILNALVLQEN